MTRMGKVTEIIIHCSSTYARMDWGAEEIRECHVKENGWDDIGYHWVIRRNGAIEPGRSEYYAGAHCTGHNSKAVGVCFVGGLGDNGKPEDNFTKAQFDSGARLVKALMERFPNAKVYGHSDFADKACPVFNVKDFLRRYNLC